MDAEGYSYTVYQSSMSVVWLHFWCPLSI